jgi:TolB-like protein/Tfp pilus assembly protein PilF
MGGLNSFEQRQKLQSWKEIAAFLGKDVRTARRWNLERGLPVHRVPGGKGGSVFAYADELQAWLDQPPSEQSASGQPPAGMESLASPPPEVHGETQINEIPPSSLFPGSEEAPARRFIRGSTIVATIAVLAAGSYFAGKLLFRPASPTQQSSSAVHADTRRVMLAVLPFTNLSGDSGQEYFSDGLTEEMITQLARLDPERLGIIARNSVMVYKSTPKSVREIGQELSVEYVLEGSVLRRAGRAHVQANLIRVSDQAHVWAGSYDRTTRDIYVLENQVTREIASEIRIGLGSNTGKAVAADPHFALAYAGLADTYSVMSGYGVMPPQESYPKARSAALRALELDGTLGEAHATLASILSDHDHNWADAEREFRRALDLNPGYATTHQWRSENLSWMGRHQEAIDEIERARQLDPLSPSINASSGSAFYMARKFDKSIEVLRKTVEMYPDFAYAHSRLGYSLLAAGKIEEAKSEFETALRLSNRNANYLTGIGCALALENKLNEARRVAGQMVAASCSSYVSPFAVALIYTSTGDKDRALGFLEKALQEQDDNINALNVEPALDPLRNDPRFQALLQRLVSNPEHN